MEVTMSDRLNLEFKWNDFQSNASRSFGLFRNEAYLQDVTIVSDDCKMVSAHKLVLSACSEYFRNILQQTRESRPLLCLEGVTSEDLKGILDYVYEGEVKIAQENLDRFLDVARRLKLDGLVTNIQNDDNIKAEELYEEPIEEIREDNPQSVQHQERESDTTLVATRNDAEDMTEEEALIDEEQRKPGELRIRVPNPVQKLKKRTKDKGRKKTKPLEAIKDNGETLSKEEYKQIFSDNVILNPDETVSCKICGKVFISFGHAGKAKYNAKVHMETHIEGLNYRCNQCDKTFSSRSNFRYHKTKHPKI